MRNISCAGAVVSKYWYLWSLSDALLANAYPVNITLLPACSGCMGSSYGFCSSSGSRIGTVAGVGRDTSVFITPVGPAIEYEANTTSLSGRGGGGGGGGGWCCSVGFIFCFL